MVPYLLFKYIFQNLYITGIKNDLIIIRFIILLNINLNTIE